MPQTQPHTKKSDIKKALKIGCLSLLAIFVIVVAVIAAYIYSAYHSITSDIDQWQREKIITLNRGRLQGLEHFDIAFKACELYTAPTGTDDWEKAALDYGQGQYPRFLTGCTTTDYWVEGEWLIVKTCAQAIGAGGGCARAGTFRSRDGKKWLRIP